MSILCYHEVDPDWQSTLCITPEVFARHCRWLARRDVLPLDQAAPLAALGGRLPRGSSCITFDDGFPGVGNHAWPILREFSLPATVFIVARTMVEPRPVDWVDGVEPTTLTTMSRAEVEALTSEGMAIGSHSMAHHDLTTLTEAEVKSDLRESREILEDLTDGPIRHLAYPRGRHNDMVRRAARSAGYLWGHALPEVGEVGGAWAVPRVGVYPGNSVVALAVKSEPFYARLRTSAVGPALSAAVQKTRSRLPGSGY